MILSKPWSGLPPHGLGALYLWASLLLFLPLTPAFGEEYPEPVFTFEEVDEGAYCTVDCNEDGYMQFYVNGRKAESIEWFQYWEGYPSLLERAYCIPSISSNPVSIGLWQINE